MAVNKVEINGNTIVDLTSDTVSPDTLLEGVTAHDKTGMPISGQLTMPVTSVNGGIGDVVIGSRNYLRDTKNMSEFTLSSGGQRLIGTDGFAYISLPPGVPTSSSSGHKQVTSRPFISFALVRGKEITLSFMARSSTVMTTSSTIGFALEFDLSTSTSTTRIKYRIVNVSGIEIGTDWTRCSYTAILNDAFFSSGTGTIDEATRLCIRIYNTSTNTLDIMQPDLGIGNVSRDWMPAPEDAEESLAIINDRLDNLFVGGRNLALGSDVEKSVTSSVLTYSLSDYGLSVITVGKEVTVSFEVKSTISADVVDVYLRSSASDLLGSAKAISVTDAYARYAVTLNVTNVNDLATIAIRHNNLTPGADRTATVTVRNVKVGLGKVDTDWTLAPEDMRGAPWTGLWTNSIGTSEFPAQKISVPGLGDYETFIVYYRRSTSATYRGSSMVRVPKNNNRILTLSLPAVVTNGLELSARSVTIDRSDNSIEFSGGRVLTPTSGTDNDAHLIPLEIYGIPG